LDRWTDDGLTERRTDLIG